MDLVPIGLLSSARGKFHLELELANLNRIATDSTYPARAGSAPDAVRPASGELGDLDRVPSL